MNERLEKIRQLLSELEDEMAAGEAPIGDRDFPGLELPLIIQEIVDDLQPLLSPYEAAFYWHLLRHSLAENGKPLLRVSTRGLQRGVVKSFRAGAISLRTVRETLAALEALGAIRKEGEPNRDGTPYRVLIPDEIEASRRFRAERTAIEPRPEIAAADIDCYNIRENRIKVYERDAYKCRYCEKQLTRFTATLDHVTSVAEGGDNSFGNLITACLNCNSRKHKRPVGDFLAEQ
ncbi:MAG: HNH endonuclease signature motif containing protein [Bryobacteraceae bacterium]